MQRYNEDLDFENSKILTMDNEIQQYIAKEDDMFTSALGLLSGMEMKGAIPFKTFKTTFSTHLYLQGFYNSRAGDIYVKSRFTVRANHSQLAARVSNLYKRFRNPAYDTTKRIDLDGRDFIEHPNAHSSIYCQDYNFPSPISDREIIANIIWKRVSDDIIIVAVHPLTSHPKVDTKDTNAVIRGMFHSVFRITQLETGLSKVEWGLHINFGGHLPKPVVYNFLMPNFDRVLSHLQAYFANSIRLSDLSLEDGQLLGEVLVNQVKRAKKKGDWRKSAELGKVGVDQFLYISVAMRELLPRYPWLRILLHTIAMNKVRVAPTVITALSELKDDDAENLGKGMLTIILSNTEASAAVDHWIAQNPALEEFEKEQAWMRPFFVEIAQYSLSTSNFGLKLRVFGGALLSTIDLITDAYMTFDFFSNENEDQASFGRLSAAFIGLTMLIQIIISYGQNHKKTSYFVQDAFYVLIGFKSALDAYRVGSGLEREDHHVLSPLHEMTFCRCVEMIFEAVPASIVQIYALVVSKERKRRALFSILVSAATIGYTSSMVSYDWDTSSAQRKKAPSFYGFVPDKALRRAICFLSMLFLSFSHVLLRTFSCALLAITNFNWLMWYLGADMVLFFLYKIARNDFHYFVPLNGALRFVASFITRFGEKLIVDFTMMIHLRNPNEVGGLPFVFSVVLSLVASFVSVSVYLGHYDGEEKIGGGDLQTVLITLSTIWAASLIALVSVMNKDYLRTFYNMDTISDYNRRTVLDLREDQEELKALLFLDHQDTYKKWGDTILKPWTLSSWDRWEAEKPTWFTDAWIEHVPNDYIPWDWCVKYKKTKGRIDPKKRRNSTSIKELFGREEDR
ncbi:hypothetical protein TL16_g08167 [Triparma laevis f. inornata]|uniref:START domain-containing protein n=1 Tax=Triparma laevis f. inornata TaxID=1714386 RepID=A0A9W7B0X3_9STRA|nr:hypothetical protein TL16_g08167 [Triparma laevis f. inornata]